MEFVGSGAVSATEYSVVIVVVGGREECGCERNVAPGMGGTAPGFRRDGENDTGRPAGGDP